MNDNGQRILEVCSFHNLCVTNTFFNTKPHHRVSWWHPRTKHWHQLDLILTRRASLNNVKITRSYHSADCDTDHSLVCGTVKLRACKIYHPKKKAAVKINTNFTSQADVIEKFNSALQEVLPEAGSHTVATDAWNKLKEDVHSTSITILGKRKSKSQDWFEAHSAELLPILEEKRQALLEKKKKTDEENTAALKEARSIAQTAARCCANSYYVDLSSRIQQAADVGNIRGMYQGINEATGPRQNKTAPLMTVTGELIKDKPSQMKRWVEHYPELYAIENKVTEVAMEAVERLPTIDELDFEPSEEDISTSLNSLTKGKSPGSDGIPAEILKCGQSTLLPHLHHLLKLCWKEKAVPQDLRDANIITIYKNKGSRGDCNNYRGISLLSIVGKLFARVVLKRLQVLANRVYPESQCGFRAGRSTIDMVFSVRQLQEKCREQERTLYMAFIDLTKAFDLVSRDGLFKILERIGCPPTLLSIVKSFHDDMKGTIVHDGSSSEPFDIRSGVKQGCVLAPTLFGIFFAVLLKQAFGDTTEGIYLHTRMDGNLFNLTSLLKAKTMIGTCKVRDFLFADDAAIATHDESSLQHLMNRFSEACQQFGLTISIKKTTVMGQLVDNTPKICIESEQLKTVNEFTYLGSVISDNLSLETELNQRIGKASATLSRLTKRVWTNKKLTERTKILVYKACVLSTLLYGSEAWTLMAHHENRLHVFHMRCLRKILGLTWEDKVTNEKVLTRAGITSMSTLLKQKRLRWLGHVHRMEDTRIPKCLMYGELATGARPQGRPFLRFRDTCKRDVKAIGLDPDTWHTLAIDRDVWKQEVKDCLNDFQEKQYEQWNEKRSRRKARKTKTSVTY